MTWQVEIIVKSAVIGLSKIDYHRFGAAIHLELPVQPPDISADCAHAQFHLGGDLLVGAAF